MAKNHHSGKRGLTRLLALILCVLLGGMAVVGVLITVAYGEESPGNATQITLTVEEGAQGPRALQVTRYVNQTGGHLSQVIFSLGANSMRRLSTAPFEDEELAQAYPQGFNVGGVQMERVMVDDRLANWGVQGDGETFIRVDCDLEQGESALFQFEYQVLLPQAQGFLGTGDIGWRLSYFTLAPCVFQDGDFACVEIGPVGECAYFVPQDYSVTIDAPDTYLIASGGEQHSQDDGQGRRTTTLTLHDTVSFALALSRRYTLYQGEQVQGVDLACYANTGWGTGKALEAASRILEVYIGGLGDCPVDKIAIAQVDGVRQVESHDGLLLVDQSLFALGKEEELERTLALGLARQWFGLSVENDPEQAPWLSEAVCAYLALLYYQDQYGDQRFLEELNLEVLDALNITLPGRLSPDALRSQFSSRSAYEIIVRRRGAAVLHEMSKAVGRQALWDTFKSYYQANRGQTADKGDFEEALLQAAGQDYSQALDHYMQTISEYVDQRLEWYE